MDCIEGKTFAQSAGVVKLPGCDAGTNLEHTEPGLDMPACLVLAHHLEPVPDSSFRGEQVASAGALPALRTDIDFIRTHSQHRDGGLIRRIPGQVASTAPYRSTPQDARDVPCAHACRRRLRCQ